MANLRLLRPFRKGCMNEVELMGPTPKLCIGTMAHDNLGHKETNVAPLPRGGHSNGPYADSLPLSDHFQGGGGGGAGSGGEGGLVLRGGGEGELGLGGGGVPRRGGGRLHTLPRKGGGGRLHTLTNMA